MPSAETCRVLPDRQNARTLPFIGTAGSLEGLGDIVQYTAAEPRPPVNTQPLHWHKRRARGGLRTRPHSPRIAAQIGSPYQPTGTLRISGDA
ncbi:hypothetical protein B7R77_01135 [Ralstonia solanacearum K60]|uniref:Uncharacterized protein n=1 Tax=Ralstonia solanacearum K60 TaxID=1091042 RepID=A0AAP8D2U0_RALSL|nr:hypothetical protein B7R77_01135 [Ralstonia solanacearum K60]RIJ88390.1 hypothetical protein RSP822_00875 [Ralstonia solanacearum]CCF96132.1 hypothetical protein RSK60_1340011 [Ralstonia solanacearum K60]